MEPSAIIESYVDDVIRRLPRRLQGDVGLELRSLLSDELDANAREAGKPADDAMTLSLLRSFGAPQEVADGYRPGGFTIIRPAEAPDFAKLSLGGVALQWAVTLLSVFMAPNPAARLPVWLLTWGLGALWWPGLLVTIHLAAAWLRGRNDERTNWMPAHVFDRDRVNRPLLVLALAFWIVGAAILIALPWLGQLVPSARPPLIAAFAFDDTFLIWRAPFVLPLWAASFAVQMAVIAAGRWTQTTRRIETALAGVWTLLLFWFVFGGHIFQQENADGTVKLALFALAFVSLGTLIVNMLRERRRLRMLQTTTSNA